MAQPVRYTAAVPSTVSNLAWMFIKISQKETHCFSRLPDVQSVCMNPFGDLNTGTRSLDSFNPFFEKIGLGCVVATGDRFCLEPFARRFSISGR